VTENDNNDAIAAGCSPLRHSRFVMKQILARISGPAAAVCIDVVEYEQKYGHTCIIKRPQPIVILRHGNENCRIKAKISDPYFISVGKSQMAVSADRA